MADSYDIQGGVVYPVSGGRRCRDVDSCRDASPLELEQQEKIESLEGVVADLESIIEELRPCPGWYCLKCGAEDIPGEGVTFEETHEGCGGKCI